MKNRKIRFNAIDALIILVIVAAVYLVLNIFVFSDGVSGSDKKDYKNITYIIELNNLLEQFTDAIKEGDVVTESVKSRDIGTVTGVQVSDYKKLNFDYEENRLIVAPVPDKYTLTLTITAKVEETDDAFKTESGEIIRVGYQYGLEFPGMYAVGYCIAILDND